MFAEFINTYGLQLLYAALTAIAGYIGIAVKNLYQKYIDDKTKQDIAHTVVKGVEQLYKDLHGEDKLNMALATAADMLTDRGITVTDLELRILIEAALAEFNEAFKKAE